ncbi:MAG: alanine--tRNA ligase, partial [Phycisphaerae bacterium]
RAPVNGEDPRVMEIWNNVFIQYNRDAQGVLTTLPAQHVDTGMGLERICQVIQGCDDNYGTDLFTPIFAALSRLSEITYQGKFPKTNAADPVAEAADTQLRYDIAFRVIADHLRCLTFALTDGATPSNEGRGYVLRRILRRAVRFGRQQLNLREPFLHTLVPVVVETMGAMFPELKKNPQAVVELIKDEEVSFGRTLDRGIQLFDQAAADGAISASAAFKLHDTYGFPVDLTRIMAEERGLKVDIAGYEALMEEAKEKARAGGKEGESAVYDLPPDALARLEALQVRATEESAKYQFKPITATVRALWNGRNFEQHAQVAHQQEDLLAVILDMTNFYAEMGGQVGDQGELTSPAGDRFEVLTTRSVGKYVLHVGRMEKGRLSVGESVTCQLAKQRRAIMQNHTATHLANWALREVLGEHVQQKGSLVDADKLRFDFVHTKALETAEVTAVEAHVNRCIAAQMPVYIELAPQEQALKIHGLRAVFGEKYPSQVRVVAVGQPVGTLLATPDNPQWRQYSVEFCGGTHLGNTSEVEQFVLVSEEAVSKGIRRVVGVTGAVANEVAAHARTVELLISHVAQVPDAELTGLLAALQKALAEELPLRVRKAAQAAVAEVQVKIKNAQKAAAKSDPAVDAPALEQLLSQATKVGGATLIVAQFNGVSADGLRNAMDWLKKKHGEGNIAILLGSDFVESDKDGNPLPAKANLLAAVGDPLIGKLKAGDWIKAVAALVGGSGGGRPQMAMAGGKDPTQLPQALAAGRSFAEGKLA